jgi:hypothetical protein
MNKTVSVSVLLCVGAISASAQFGGLWNKVGGKKPGTDVMVQGQDLLGYVTIASDNGVKAVEALASVFPPDKVQKVADLAVKYNELKAKRGDQDIDAESIQITSQIAAEMAQLDSEWQTHLKEKSAAVRVADARLALVILADGLAATKAPETARTMESAAQDLMGDPMQTSKAKHMMSMASLLVTIGKEVPQQVASYKTVREMAKRIAEAEKVHLAADPSPDKVKDKVSLETSTKQLTE